MELVTLFDITTGQYQSNFFGTSGCGEKTEMLARTSRGGQEKPAKLHHYNRGFGDSTTLAGQLIFVKETDCKFSTLAR